MKVYHRFKVYDADAHADCKLHEWESGADAELCSVYECECKPIATFKGWKSLARFIKRHEQEVIVEAEELTSFDTFKNAEVDAHCEFYCASIECVNDHARYWGVIPEQGYKLF